MKGSENIIHARFQVDVTSFLAQSKREDLEKIRAALALNSSVIAHFLQSRSANCSKTLSVMLVWLPSEILMLQRLF